MSKAQLRIIQRNFKKHIIVSDGVHISFNLKNVPGTQRMSSTKLANTRLPAPWARIPLQFHQLFTKLNNASESLPNPWNYSTTLTEGQKCVRQLPRAPNQHTPLPAILTPNFLNPPPPPPHQQQNK